MLINAHRAKICSHCKTEQPVINYWYNKSASDGLDHYCKTCSSIRHQKWFINHPNYSTAKRRENRHRSRLLVLSHYGGVCSQCGEDKLIFLTVDHINGKKAWDHSRSLTGHRLYEWIITNDYPVGFRVLCFNCNCAIESHSTSRWSQYRRILKCTVFSHYGYKCACCGITNPLALVIDHIEGREKYKHAFNFTGYRLYRWLINNNFPVEFRTLCWNCNYAVSHGTCPHIQSQPASQMAGLV